MVKKNAKQNRFIRKEAPVKQQEYVVKKQQNSDATKTRQANNRVKEVQVKDRIIKKNFGYDFAEEVGGGEIVQPCPQALSVNDTKPFHRISSGFSGCVPSKIVIDHLLGKEAEANIRKHFNYLLGAGPGSFSLTGSKHHDHPSSAFWRRHYDRAITNGLSANQYLLDVGGHATRTHSQYRVFDNTFENNAELRYSENNSVWYETIHSMYPSVDADDLIRHKKWESILKTWDNDPGWLENACRTKADQGLCDCTVSFAPNCKWREISNFKSIDSAYYDGVLSGIEFEMVRQDCRPMAYLAFHDYHGAIRSMKTEYSTWDNESQVKIDSTGNYYTVSSQVNGNPYVYQHKVVQTAENSWYRYYPSAMDVRATIIYTIVERADQKGHNYILVEVMAMHGALNLNIPYLQDYFVSTGNLSKPLEGALQLLIDIKPKMQWSGIRFPHKNKVAKEMVNCVSTFISQNVRNHAEIYFTDNVETYQVKLSYIDTQEQFITDDLTVNVKVFNEAYKQFVGKSNMQELLRGFRPIQTKYAGDVKFAIVTDSCVLASIVAASQTAKFLHTVHFNSTLDTLRQMSNGFFNYGEVSTSWFKYFMMPFAFMLRIVINCLKGSFWLGSLLGTMLTILTICIVIPNLFPAVYAGRDNIGVFTSTLTCLVATGIMTFGVVKTCKEFLFVKKIEHRNRRWLIGSCVRDKQRLDNKILSKHSRIRYNNSDWDISKCVNGEEAAEKLGCTCPQRVEAGQMGFILHGTTKYEPTIVHACKQTQLAASFRACSNQIQPDPKILQLWKPHLMTYFKRLTQWINEDGGMKVDVNDWLLKYPIAYREKMLQEIRKPTLFEGKYYYNSFPKKELQFTEVPSCDKDTDLNKVKERQISGPVEAKKIAANAFVNALEHVAHKHLKGYCGMKNWEEICATLDEQNSQLLNPYYAFADGSGFDMTQTSEIQKAFNEGIKYVLDNADLDIDTLLDKEIIMRAFTESICLDVRVDRGSVIYKAEGRASGDGWTTFGNTILMMSYWTFIFEQLSIKPDKYFLLVKGDDVILGMEKYLQESVEFGAFKFMSKENIDIEFGLGQVLKKLDWGTLEDGDFLSNRFFMRMDGTHRMIRIPARVLQTTPWSTKLHLETRNKGRVAAELAYSKGMCMLAWAKDIPIFHNYALKLIELGQEGLNSDYNKYADDMRVWSKSRGDDYNACATWMHEQFGLTMNQIESIETAIDNITSLKDEVEIEALNVFY